MAQLIASLTGYNLFGTNTTTTRTPTPSKEEEKNKIGTIREEQEDEFVDCGQDLSAQFTEAMLKSQYAALQAQLLLMQNLSKENTPSFKRTEKSIKTATKKVAKINEGLSGNAKEKEWAPNLDEMRIQDITFRIAYHKHAANVFRVHALVKFLLKGIDNLQMPPMPSYSEVTQFNFHHEYNFILGQSTSYVKTVKQIYGDAKVLRNSMREKLNLLKAEVAKFHYAYTNNGRPCSSGADIPKPTAEEVEEIARLKEEEERRKRELDLSSSVLLASFSYSSTDSSASTSSSSSNSSSSTSTSSISSSSSSSSDSTSSISSSSSSSSDSSESISTAGVRDRNPKNKKKDKK